MAGMFTKAQMRMVWAFYWLSTVTIAVLTWMFFNYPIVWIGVGCFLLFEMITALQFIAKYGPK